MKKNPLQSKFSPGKFSNFEDTKKNFFKNLVSIHCSAANVFKHAQILASKVPIEQPNRVARVFLVGRWYQNQKNIPNEYKMCILVIKYPKCN
jgi:hypothetical protein